MSTLQLHSPEGIVLDDPSTSLSDLRKSSKEKILYSWP